MQAIVFENGELNLVNKSCPKTEYKEVLVRTLKAGICATDLELYKGMYGFKGVPGHEFVGRVEHDPGGHLTGERVVADINCGCGICSFCIQKNNARHCAERSVLGIRSRNGAFAEYVSVPGENLHIVPEEISDDQAVFAEPLAAALRIAEQIHLTSQTRVAVLGDGKLGLLIAFSLGLYSENIDLLGHHRANLDIAAKKGINTFNTAESSWRDVVQGHNKYDLVVEATGSPSGLEEAIDLTRPQGTIVLKTTCSSNCSVDTSRIAVQELKIQGSRCGNISWALYNLKKGRINVEPLIEAVYPFHDFQQAMQHAAVNGAKKILLDLSCM